MRWEAGFTLLEVVCVLAVFALLTALALPSLPRETSGAKLEMFALKAAALLIGDRNAAIRRHVPVATSLSESARTLRSGVSSDIVQFPEDVAFDALLAEECNGHIAGPNIEFFPSGMSCGGIIALGRPGIAYQIRVNWLTGGAEVVSVQPTAR
jgi:general secretion pathway protein H